MLFLLWGMICGEVTRKDHYGRPYKAFIGAHVCNHLFPLGPRTVAIANDNEVQAA